MPGRLVIPVQGVRADQLVDTWGDSRSGGERLHEAIDIMAPRGTPVLSADEGEVLRVSENRAGGLTIYATDAALTDKVEIAGTFPAGSHPSITYPMAIIARLTVCVADAADAPAAALMSTG